MPEPIFLEDVNSTNQHDLKMNAANGLLANFASISPKFLYDSLGSHLFTAITLLPEYYPTKTESSILNQYKHEIAEAVGKNQTLIDLGAGNCQKAELLFSSVQPTSYVAIDFSIEYLKEVLVKLQTKYPQINMCGIGMDFSQDIVLPNSVPKSPRTFFYPGSSIGNFLVKESERFLAKIKSQTENGGLLIGVDLMKDEKILKAAYDDPLKLTAAFNLNILRVVNGLIGANFDVSHFRHLVKINHNEKRVELYLEALVDVAVSWEGNSRTFKRGELIHTENSHKYTIDSIKQLLINSGYKSFNIWTDPKKYFAVIYAE
jgi:dimethylhistidine N-methyltransferase